MKKSLVAFSPDDLCWLQIVYQYYSKSVVLADKEKSIEIARHTDVDGICKQLLDLEQTSKALREYLQK